MKRILYLLIGAVCLAGCTTKPASTAELETEEKHPLIVTIRDYRTPVSENEVRIPAGLPYTTMDINVYRLEDDEWKLSERFQNILLSETYDSYVKIWQTETDFSINDDSYTLSAAYSVPFEQKTEGYAGGYAWTNEPIDIVPDTDIPVYGHVRNQGTSIRVFVLEEYENETYFDEGILFTVRFPSE